MVVWRKLLDDRKMLVVELGNWLLRLSRLTYCFDCLQEGFEDTFQGRFAI